MIVVTVENIIDFIILGVGVIGMIGCMMYIYIDKKKEKEKKRK